MSKFWQWLDDEVNHWQFCDTYDPHCQHGPKPTYLGYVLLILCNATMQRVRMALCWWFDHDLEMEGWATPDTGGESWQCKRCGHGGSHTYY